MLALGKEYIEMGGYNEALAQFNKAMQIDPRSGEPKQQSGWANYLLEKLRRGSRTVSSRGSPRSRQSPDL